MPTYKFDVGNSNTGPLGFVARIHADTPALALQRLRDLLPDQVEDVVARDRLDAREYVTVYFNDENLDLDDLDTGDTEPDDDPPDPPLVTRTVFGREGRFHSDVCAESMREDRRAGLVHGPYARPDGSLYDNAEQASRACEFCAYCGPTEFEKKEGAPPGAPQPEPPCAHCGEPTVLRANGDRLCPDPACFLGIALTGADPMHSAARAEPPPAIGGRPFSAERNDDP